jgi:uncharacterized protein YjiS (DUF1127 family)
MSKESLPPDLVRAVTRFGEKMRTRFAPIDRRAAARIGRLLASVLVPRRKRGRKPTPQVLTAVRMRAKKADWLDVYSAVIYDYRNLHPCERIHHARKLRRNVAALLKRRRSARPT